MEAQLAVHRSHWKLALPPQLPGPAVAVKAWPARATPATVGAESIEGLGTRLQLAAQSSPVVSRVAEPPVSAWMKRDVVSPGMLRWKTIRVPSGENVGVPSLTAEFVTCRAPLPSAPATQIEHGPTPSQRTNAMRFPSGEKLGWTS